MRGRESFNGELCARKLYFISFNSLNAPFAGTSVLVCC